MITDQLLQALKQITETRWQQRPINRQLYGFQFQSGTRWNPGLDERNIADYEASVGVRFPNDFRTFLSKMNGTDLPTLNVFGDSGRPDKHWAGVYAYPRDLQLVKDLISQVRQGRDQLQVTMEEQGFTIPSQCDFVPIYAHRYVLCTENASESTVLSIHDSTDAIVCGATLAEYLQREFLAPQNSGLSTT
jgi:hypothetical protein